MLSLVLHNAKSSTTGKYITPMYIVADNANEIATRIVQTSDHCADVKPDFKIEKMSKLDLDPGGMYFQDTQHIKFVIDGVTCDIQASKAEDVLWHMEHATERLPGVMRFRMWYWNFVMPVSFFNQLKAKVSEISTSDAALHAQLDENEVKTKIEAECPYVKFKVPHE
jgi:hypothetical protein